MTELVVQAEELARLSELQRVFDAFAENDIPVIVYKGTALAYRYYSQPFERERCDTDLMIQREDLPRLKTLLSQMGYRFLTTSDEGRISYQVACEITVEGVKSVLDIHWKFSNRTVFKDLYDYAKLRQAAEPIPVLGHGIWCPDRVDSLIIACLHPIMHHQSQFEADWIEDIQILLAGWTESDSQQLKMRAENLGVAQALLAALDRVPAKGDLPSVLRNVRSDSAIENFVNGTHSRFSVARSDFLNLPTWRERLIFLRRHLFPNKEYMRRQYGKAPLFWVYPWRLIRGTYKLLRNIST